MAGNTRFGGIAVALANPQFRLYTVGSVPSLLGTWIQRLAVAWLAWKLTQSHAWVGAVAMADMLPFVFLAPLAGAFADRLDRLKAARLLQLASMAHATVLATLAFANLIEIEILLVLALVQGIIQAVLQPFRHAIVANLVSREELPGAIAVNSITWHTSRFIGPVLAGIILDRLGIGAAFAINAATFPPFVYALYRLSLAHLPRVKRSLAEIPREILDAARYITGHRIIGPIIAILFVNSFIGRAVMELLPGFAGEVFDGEARILAILVSSTGFGAVIGGLWFGLGAKRDRLMPLVVVNTLLLALGHLSLAATDRIEIAMASLAVMGFGLTIAGIAIQTIVQSEVDEALRGRVMSVYGVMWIGSPGLGALILGTISDVTGIRWPVLGAALILLAFWTWVWLRERRGLSSAAPPGG
jgi:MFS family permease